MRKRGMLIGVLVLVGLGLWLAYATHFEPGWRDDDAEFEPPGDAPRLRWSPIVRIHGDSGEYDLFEVQALSHAVFDDEYLWLFSRGPTNRSRGAVTRVSLDDRSLERVPTVGWMLPKSTAVLGERVVWVVWPEPGTPNAQMVAYAMPRDLSRGPERIATFDPHFAYIWSRPVKVGDELVFLGGWLDRELSAASLALVPVDGGEPRYHGFGTMLCSVPGEPSHDDDSVLVTCHQRDPTSALFEVAVPGPERHVVRQDRSTDGWHPDEALRVGDSTILVGQDHTRGGTIIKRLDADGQLRSLVRLSDRSQQMAGVLRGDQTQAFYYCHQGACKDGRLFWFGPKSWGEVPDPPARAVRVDYSGGVLYWQQREDDTFVMSATYPWVGPPLEADTSYVRHESHRRGFEAVR